MHPAAGPARTGASLPQAAAEGAQAASGDPFGERLLAVYQDKHRVLHRLARRELAAENLPASRADAEDIVQDAYVITLANRDKIHTGELYAYLCTVIRTRVQDLDRRKASVPLDPTDPAAPYRAPLWVSAVQQDTDTVVDVGRALQQISPQQRRLILLSYSYDCTHAEIAELTGVHRGTVATHIRRAKTALTALLALALLALTAFAAWARELAAQLRWIDVGSNGQAKPPGLGLPIMITLYVLCVGVAILVLRALYVRLVQRPLRYAQIFMSTVQAEESRILHAMTAVSAELSASHPEGPTPEDYASRIGTLPSTITTSLNNGRLDSSIPAGTIIPLHLRLGQAVITEIQVLEDGKVRSLPPEPTPMLRWSSDKGWIERPSYTSPPSSDGAEGAP
ncbi:RNA polymerase sigma factor [Streptomyces hydrogenans]|uniref:RNA polymerase sigma factor n=1 Tax=Streptomyces hydrogenans TaxID=1873719 RepID=UPI0035E075C6